MKLSQVHHLQMPSTSKECLGALGGFVWDRAGGLEDDSPYSKLLFPCLLLVLGLGTVMRYVGRFVFDFA